MESKMQKHIKLYIRRNGVLIFGIALFIIFILVIVSIWFRPKTEDIIIPTAFTAVSSIAIFLISLLYTIRFKKMIRFQESTYDVDFENQNEVAINSQRLLYISNDWLIFSGTMAFHHDYIKSLSKYKTYTGRAGVGYKITIITVDDKKYGAWFNSTTEIKRVQKWRYDMKLK